MLCSLQMDNQNIKKTLNIQQNQIDDIRNIAKTQNHPADISQRPDALKQNTSRMISKNNTNSNISLAEFQPQRSSSEAFNRPAMHIMDDAHMNHPMHMFTTLLGTKKILHKPQFIKYSTRLRDYP